MKVSSNTNLSISFTEEEKEILNKAKDILKEVYEDLWQKDNDDLDEVTYMFYDASYVIKRILEENY
jgi:hypothetical protein